MINIVGRGVTKLLSPHS